MSDAVRLPFEDRAGAGRALAEALTRKRFADPIVLALPRGGVTVALPIAQRLAAPLDLLLVRKIGVPYQPELAVAAVMDGESPVLVIDEPIRADTGVSRDYIEREAQVQLAEIERRRRAYLGGRAPLPVAGKTAIVVDDGIATGTTMRAAVKGLRQRGPARIVIAVPVAPPETVAALRREVDDVVCLAQPKPFGAIGYFYRDFHQLSDDEVMAALAAAPGPAPESV